MGTNEMSKADTEDNDMDDGESEDMDRMAG